MHAVLPALKQQENRKNRQKPSAVSSESCESSLSDDFRITDAQIVYTLYTHHGRECV